MAGRLRANAPAPFRLRRATLADLAVLTEHRLEMWREIGHHTPREIRNHAAPYRLWLRSRLRSGEVVAYLATVGGEVAGSGALWFMPQEPRPGIPRGEIPYICSMYTRPSDQRKGIASAIVRILVRTARRTGAARVTLHAADQGKAVYARLGFEPTSEMRLWLRRPAWAGPPPDPARPRARGGSPR
jgi:GNAT superfamily N-acetyltransferase